MLDNHKKLELYTCNKLNKEIYSFLKKYDTPVDQSLKTFDIVFQILDVINHYEWNWIKKWDYLKSYLAQITPAYQCLVIRFAVDIGEDRLDLKKDDIHILLTKLSGLNPQNNTHVDNDILKIKVINSDINTIVEGFCRVRGWVMKEKEIIGNFIDDIIEKTSSRTLIRSSYELLHKTKTLIDSTIKQDIEIDGGYRYLWNDKKPLKEIDSQPFLKLLFKKYSKSLDIKCIEYDTKATNGHVNFTLIKNNHKVCVEVINAHHKAITTSINRQFATYMDHEKTASGVYLVLWFKSSDGFPFPEHYSKIEDLKRELDIKKNTTKNITVIIIDCSLPIPQMSLA